MKSGYPVPFPTVTTGLNLRWTAESWNSLGSLVALCSRYGGRIVHGSHPTFTPVIVHEARLHCGARMRKPITLVMSDLWARQMNQEAFRSVDDVAEIIITKAIGEGGPEDSETRNRSLSAMRRVLVDSLNLIVAVGGKKHAVDGKTPGIQEELDLAAEQNIPRFIVAGMGGYAEEYARKVDPAALDNELSAEQNRLLFESSDVGACVNVLLNHLSTSEKLPRAADRPIKWNPGIRKIIDHRDGSVVSQSSELVVAAAA